MLLQGSFPTPASSTQFPQEAASGDVNRAPILSARMAASASPPSSCCTLVSAAGGAVGNSFSSCPSSGVASAPPASQMVVPHIFSSSFFSSSSSVPGGFRQGQDRRMAVAVGNGGYLMPWGESVGATGPGGMEGPKKKKSGRLNSLCSFSLRSPHQKTREETSAAAQDSVSLFGDIHTLSFEIAVEKILSFVSFLRELQSTQTRPSLFSFADGSWQRLVSLHPNLEDLSIREGGFWTEEGSSSASAAAPLSGGSWRGSFASTSLECPLKTTGGSCAAAGRTEEKKKKREASSVHGRRFKKESGIDSSTAEAPSSCQAKQAGPTASQPGEEVKEEAAQRAADGGTSNEASWGDRCNALALQAHPQVVVITTQSSKQLPLGFSLACKLLRRGVRVSGCILGCARTGVRRDLRENRASFLLQVVCRHTVVLQTAPVLQCIHLPLLGVPLLVASLKFCV